VQEIADQKGMAIKAYNPRELRKMHSEIIDSTDAKRVLIVGHSNTTPVLANFLSDTKYYTSSFDDNEYDNLIIVLDNGPEDKELIPVKFKP
jgi:metallophosphoesterase superfamily enzyme